ncbi:MAG TPA: hypothetical protein VGF55_07625 [Gemmataceae bacterium]
MEDQDRPAAVTAGRAGAPPAASGAPADWLVGPAFDLLFVANLGWLLALVPGYVAADGAVHVEFWQVYFLTTPHRWLTLLLVAADPDRRAGRPRLLLTLAALIAAAVAGVYLATGTFLCLLLIDYVWNGWHFASQHAGVLRVYALKTGGGRPVFEKWGLRLFVCYVIARTAGWTTGWLEAVPAAAEWLPVLDGAALALAAALVLPAVFDRPRARPGKTLYLLSVVGLYAALLAALMARAGALVLALTAAGALFHAVEYIALVTHYARRRRAAGGGGAFRVLARHWLTVLAGFVLAVGLLAATAADSPWWFGLNLWAGFLHYAYDGLIWKLRQPATARALGAVLPPAAAARAEPELAAVP